MCGIAGIVDKSFNPVSKSLISGITNKVAYRGPDAEGYYFNDNLSLGHRRLSIIDLSKLGEQPMNWEDDYIIVFNGEIYNYIEIKKELISAGYTFKTSSDTEVILAAYDKWGQECIHKFNGMWAFCIYDKIKSILFCSRDRFGIKPFYYFNSRVYFAFGSEIQQLLQFTKFKANIKTLINYLVLSVENYSEETFFQDIKELPSSHNLIYNIKNNVFKIERYYTIKIHSNLTKLPLEETANLYLSQLNSSVSYRLRSDVKVGTCLSGGLDSSAIAAIAALQHKNITDDKFCAITAQSTNPKNDETDYARQVVLNSDLEWICTKPSVEEYKNYLPEVVRTQQEPFGGPSIMMQYFVFNIAKRHGIKVLLDGQGGDESLLGYERYYPAFLLSLPLSEKIKGFSSMVSNSRLSVKELLAYHFYFTHANLRIRRLLHNHSFIKPTYLDLVDRNLIREIAHSYKDIKAMQILEFTKTQLPPLLKYEDKNSMRNSIESRLPFLDYNLVEFSLSLNDNFKIMEGWTKYVLRKAVSKIIPISIAWRKNKIGFEAPVNHWLNFQSDFEVIKNSNILNQIAEINKIKRPSSKIHWKLLNIALWEKEFNVSA
jgi:asparagine synthase (glutamine-hydrolysing)